MTLALALACRSSPPPPAAPAPDWGEIEVRADGPVTIASSGPVLCGDDHGLVFRAHAATDRPWWALSLERRLVGEPLRPVARLVLATAEDRAGPAAIWTSEAVDPGAPSGGTWSAVLAQAGPAGTVKLDLTVRCGEPVPVPESAVPILAEVAGAEVRRYSTVDLGRARVLGPISALVPRERALDLVRALRERLPPGLVAFQGTSRFADDPAERRVELVVAAGRGVEDIVRTANVDPVDHDLDAVDVAARVGGWRDRFGADLVQADAESVTVALPDSADSTEVAREAAAFCPSVIDQAGSVPAYALEIDHDHQLWCWWE